MTYLHDGWQYVATTIAAAILFALYRTWQTRQDRNRDLTDRTGG